MENQNILIGIGILILFIVIVFAAVVIRIVSIQKPIEKVKPIVKTEILKKPIYDRLIEAIERIHYEENRNLWPRNEYVILLSYKSFDELRRYLMIQLFHFPDSPPKLMGIQVRRIRKLEQDFLIIEKEEN